MSLSTEGIGPQEGSEKNRLAFGIKEEKGEKKSFNFPVLFFLPELIILDPNNDYGSMYL